MSRRAGEKRERPERAASFRHILDDFQADKTDRKQIKDILDQLVRDRYCQREVTAIALAEW